MPCYDGRSSSDIDTRVRNRLSNEIDILTKLLCEACRILRDTKNTKHMGKTLAEWYAIHVLLDEYRSNNKTTNDVVLEMENFFRSRDE